MLAVLVAGLALVACSHNQESSAPAASATEASAPAAAEASAPAAAEASAPAATEASAPAAAEASARKRQLLSNLIFTEISQAFAWLIFVVIMKKIHQYISKIKSIIVGYKTQLALD